MSPESVLPFAPNDFNRTIIETRAYISKHFGHLNQTEQSHEFDAMIGRKYGAGSALHKSFTMRFDAWAQVLLNHRFNKLVMQYGDVRILDLSRQLAALHSLEDDKTFHAARFFVELERKLPG